jgi:GAF domain-containing protein
VPGQRRVRILARLVDDGTEAVGTERLCATSAEVTGMSGAGIMLMSDDGPQGSLCVTNAVSDLIEQLQYTLGEGPCLDAYAQDRPVLEPDLVDPVTWRWPAFSGPAVDAGVRAIFGFPLRVGEVRVGALNLYSDRPRGLTGDEHADALVLADIVAQTVLMLQADAPPGTVSSELEAGADFQFVVHQAAGMVAAQMDTPVGEALARLRAHAFASGVPLPEVARAVVARTLRFDTAGGEVAV